jgi:tellurite resistance protein TerC
VGVEDYQVTILFTGGVFLLLLLDLLATAPKRGKLRLGKALWLQGVWVGAALAFCLWIGATRGTPKALQFLAGYLIEYALSLDNILVFVLVFRAAGIPETHRRLVLFWGILGALLMRGLAIAAGTAALRRFEPLTYLLAVVLAVSGFSFLRKSRSPEGKRPYEKLWELLRKFLPLTRRLHGARFFVWRAGRLAVTPLGLALVWIESADLVFAIDSIPAVFAVTTDPFIVFTSNMCAVLGLRSLYFLVAGGMEKLRYLDEGLGILLLVLAGEMALKPWGELPLPYSLALIFGILGGTVCASVSPSCRGPQR